MEPWVVFAVMAALAVLTVVFAQRQAKKRREEMMAWGAAHSLAFTPDRDRGVPARFAHLSLFRTGDNRYAYNVLHGERDGRTLYVFDYHYQTYTTGSKGERQTHHHHLSALIIAGEYSLRSLFIRAENFLDRIAGFVGFQDIDFELVEFNRAFHVKSPDRRWAFDILHQRAMEFLLESPRFSLEMGGSELAVWRGTRMNPSELDDALRTGTGLLDLIPNSVMQELRDQKRDG